ncbi:MAG TPA: ABC transporter ATP-binding protein [Chloroflexota bacterium]|nr:ABC transporter ATP-binding protein [Chloroflexota bacterium]
MSVNAPPRPQPHASTNSVLTLRDVAKTFGNVRAVDGISLTLEQGELLTLLGPSGCGKTTTLRMVIGLERCTAGEIECMGRVVDSRERRIFVPPHKRNMGMVFQSYAIWPHMSVFENVAYPLRVRRIRGAEVRSRVTQALGLVGLGSLGDRPATMLSGGQQQRVAIARSLVFEPDILLLDEPFSNLDARLREQMRVELRLLQRRLGITVLFVTHDQIEALSLSDRIAVMDAGRIEQIGAPLDLYRRPATPRVRDFLGQTVMVKGRVVSADAAGTVTARLGSNGTSGVVLTGRSAGGDLRAGEPCTLAIRPEHVSVRPSTDALDGEANRVIGRIEALLFVGERFEARVALPSGQSVSAYLPASEEWRQEQEVALAFPADRLILWPE